MTKKYLFSVLASLVILWIINPLIMPTELKANFDNNRARIDVYTQGKVENSVSVSSEDKRVQILYPEWLKKVTWLKGAGSGASINLKTAGHNRIATFQLIAEGNGKLILKLMGPDYRRANKRIPVWIDYEEVLINGQPMSGLPIIVSHDKSRSITLDVKNGEKIDIAIKHQKAPLSKINGFYSFIITDIILFALLFSVFCYGFKYIKTKKIYINKNFDIEEIIVKKWQSITPLFKKTFLLVFIILNLVFLFHTISFFWGNHDWHHVKYGLHINAAFWCGRYSMAWLQQLFGGDFFPVINMLFCFTCYTLAVISLAIYWKLPRSLFCYTLFGLVVVTSPYMLPWLYYIIQTTLLVNVFFVILAANLLLKKGLIRSIVAIFLIVSCLGAYAAMLSTLAIIILGRILIEWLFENKSVKELTVNYMNTLINIIISVIIYKLILQYYIYVGAINTNAYNFATTSISEIPQKIISVLRAIGEIFYIPQPYIGNALKTTMALSLIGALVCIIQKKGRNFLLGILLIVAILISTQFSNLFAKMDFANTVRIDFFSLPFVFSLFMVVCLKANKLLKNCIIVIMFAVLIQNIYADLRFQKVNYLARVGEMQVYNDIVSRIKADKNYQPDKQYIMITAGVYRLRPVFYNAARYNKYITHSNNNDILDYEYIPDWDEKAFYNFYEPKNYITASYKISKPISCMPSKDKVTDIASYILNNARPYPHKNSVYVKDGYIYVIYTEEGLKQAQDNIRKVLNLEGD